MARFSVSANTSAATAKLRKLRAAMTPDAMDAVVNRVAFVTHRRLVQRTPKRWTGQTRRYWRVLRRRSSWYSVTNLSQVMVWLEKGTKAHGPKSAKALFVPLNRKAAFAGPKGVMAAINAVKGTNKKPRFIAGRDFVFTKKVRGIKALHIVRDHRPFAEVTLKSAMRQYIRQVLST